MMSQCIVCMCAPQRDGLTPTARGGDVVNNRVREALERIVSTTIRQTEKITSRTRHEEQSSLKVHSHPALLVLMVD